MDDGGLCMYIYDRSWIVVVIGNKGNKEEECIQIGNHQGYVYRCVLTEFINGTANANGSQAMYTHFLLINHPHLIACKEQRILPSKTTTVIARLFFRLLDNDRLWWRSALNKCKRYQW